MRTIDGDEFGQTDDRRNNVVYNGTERLGAGCEESAARICRQTCEARTDPECDIMKYFDARI